MKEVEGFGPDNWKAAQQEGTDQGRDSVVVSGREFLVRDMSPEGRGTLESPKPAHKLRRHSGAHAPEGGSSTELMPPMPAFDRRTTEQLGLPRASQLPSLPIMDDTDIGGPPAHVDSASNPQLGATHPLAADIKRANIDKDCMRDPLNTSFYDDVWCRAAENNTKIYRRVFRVMPDSEVTNWAEYKEFKAYNDRFKESMDSSRTSEEGEKTEGVPPQQSTAGAGIGAPGPGALGTGIVEKVAHSLPKPPGSSDAPRVVEPPKDSAVEEKGALADGGMDEEQSATDREKLAAAAGFGTLSPASIPVFEDGRPPSAATSRLDVGSDTRKERRPTFSTPERPDRPPNSSGGLSANGVYLNGSTSEIGGTIKSAGSQRRRRRAATRSSRRGFSATEDMLSRLEAEELLNLTQGTLVQFPYDWLVVEETNGNWLFQVDQVAPLQI